MLFGHMDVSTLCRAVGARRPLWFDKRGSHDKMEIQKLWNEVGAILGMSGYIARLKWQNLRDTFRKEVVKLKKIREEGLQHTPTWRHFRSMGFVLELLDPESYLEWKQNNPTLYALSRPNPAPTASALDNSDPNNLTIARVVSLQDGGPSHLQDGGPSRIPRVGSSHDGGPLEPEAAVTVKVEELEEDPWEPMTTLNTDDTYGMDTGEDEDYHFLMSLLPHLKEIPKNRKLFVRQKLQQVIIDETED